MEKFTILDWKSDGLVAIKEDGSVEPFVLDKSIEEENVFRYSYVRKQLGYLLGDILTIVDAVAENPQQNKAIKDLVRNRFSAKMDWIYETSNNFGLDVSGSPVE